MNQFIFFLITFLSAFNFALASGYSHVENIELFSICSESCSLKKHSELMDSFISACEIKKSIGKCSELRSQHPEFDEQIIKCDPASICKNFYDSSGLLFQSCKKGLQEAAEDWVNDNSKLLINSAGFLKRGIQQDEYIIDLLYRAATSLKIPPELKSIIKPKKDEKTLDEKFSQQWYKKSFANLSAILSYVDKKVVENNQQYACFTETAKTEMGCYMGGVVFDPIVTASAVFKTSRLVRLANRIELKASEISEKTFNSGQSIKSLEKASINSEKLDLLEDDALSPLETGASKAGPSNGFLESKTLSGKDPPGSTKTTDTFKNPTESNRSTPSKIEYHIGEPEVGQLELGFTTDIDAPVSMITSGKSWFLPPRNEAHAVTDISADGKAFELTSPTNIKSYWVVTESGKNHMVVKKVSQMSTPFSRKKPLQYEDGPMIERLKGSFNPKSISSNDLAKQLTESQVRASNTASTSEVARENISKMNINLAEKIKSDSRLTIEDVKNWNKIANEGVLDGSTSKVGGVVRGTKETKLVSGISTSVDLSSTEMKAGNMFNYIPAAQVQVRFEKLIARINSLSTKSSLKDVAEAYQEYIIIHPFVDANGRTARAVIDYCLSRLKLPPVPPEVSIPREALYKSPDQLASEIRALYVH